MNRESAKLIATFTDEFLIDIGKPKWVENRKFIRAFGEGKSVMYKSIIMVVTCSFDFYPDDYSIHEPTQIINGIECPMYITVKPKNGDKYWYESIQEGSLCDFFTWKDDAVDNRYLALNICHETKEAAAKCCKARYGVQE